MSRVLISILLVAASCGGKTEEAPTAASGSQPAAGSAPTNPAGSAAGSSATAGSAAGSGSAVVAKEPEVPTAEDFEEDATARITEKNLETEVKLLEKEIGED
jgi:hypothetical protein